MTRHGLSGVISLFEMPPGGQIGSGLRAPDGVTKRRTSRRPLPGVRILGRLVARVAAARRQAALVRDLGRLSDRDLADLGLIRGQLPRLFAGN